MYLRAFGLRRLPFESTSNASIYVDLPNHRDAFNTILFGLRSGEGFLKVVGEVGTGKTALCRALLAELDSGSIPVYLPNPALGPNDLLHAIADELGVPVASGTPFARVQRYVREVLLDVARDGGRAVVFVDEAQTMPDEALESLRLLGNLESNLGRLVQVVFFGQPEFDGRLRSYGLRPLQQRIAFSARLEPLDRRACREYVLRRLDAAGSARAHQTFTPAAIDRIHRASGGIPRLINLLCHKSLIATFCEGELQVGRRHVARAVDESEGLRRWQTRPLWRGRRFRDRTRSDLAASVPAGAP